MMRILNTLLHDYMHEGRKCQVWLDEDGVFVTRHFEGKMWVKDITHYGHNEHWAEDAAENWVMRINS